MKLLKSLIVFLVSIMWVNSSFSGFPYDDTVNPDTKTVITDTTPLTVVIPHIVVDTPFLVDSGYSFWNDLVNLSLSDTKYDLTLRVIGYGGDAMLGQRLIKSFLVAESKGNQIHMDVIGPAYSMHAYLVCFGSDYKIEEGASLMFHRMASYSTLLFGNLFVKSTELNPALIESEKFMLDQCYIKGLLSIKDQQDILDGKEVYVFEKINGELVKTVKEDSAYEDMLQNIMYLIIDVIVVLVIIRLVCIVIRRT